MIVPHRVLALVAALGVVGMLGAGGVLAGCAAEPSARPTGTATAQEREAECAAAVASIVTAVDELAASYELPPAGETPGPAPESGLSATGETLADAVIAAREERDRLGCDAEAFTARLEEGLASIEVRSPISEAVWRRATASILGTVRQEAGEWMLEPGEDLRDAVARASEGTTIVLPAGRHEVDGTVVLLSGVTLRGAGRDETTIVSDAAETAVIIATPGLVRLEQLTIELTGAQPASGLVAGPSASVALSGVRIAGATSAEGGVGGAGVFLTAEADEAAGRGTTLEITDSLFERNAWAGIAVAGGHRVSIESSGFTGNGEVGILFLDTSSGSVNASSFDGNTVGLAATGAATPTWLASTVTGGSVGVQLDADAAPVIDGLRISGAASAAVIYGGRAGGSIGNTTCENVPYGIVVSSTAAPTLGENGCALARGGS